MYRQSEKNLLSSNTSSTCPDNMVNFCQLTAEIDWRVWGTPSYFNGYRVLQCYCTASSSGRQPNFASLNRGRHLCSAGRPSGWALAHILVYIWAMDPSLGMSEPTPRDHCGTIRDDWYTGHWLHLVQLLTVPNVSVRPVYLVRVASCGIVVNCGGYF